MKPETGSSAETHVTPEEHDAIGEVIAEDIKRRRGTVIRQEASPVSLELLRRVVNADASMGATQAQVLDGWIAMGELRSLIADPQAACNHRGAITGQGNCMVCGAHPPALGGEPEPSGITWRADGDANVYTLMRDGNWLASMRINGELTLFDQEVLLSQLISAEPSKALKEWKAWVDEASAEIDRLQDAECERDQLKARCDELEKNNRRYEWIRSQGTKWSELSPALFERVNDECNPPYMALKFGEELDSAIDASISRAALSKPAGSEQP